MTTAEEKPATRHAALAAIDAGFGNGARALTLSALILAGALLALGASAAPRGGTDAAVRQIASHGGLPRTADVIADPEAVVYRASKARMSERVETDPELAATLHRIVAVTLAERLDRTNKILGDQT